MAIFMFDPTNRAVTMSLPIAQSLPLQQASTYQFGASRIDCATRQVVIDGVAAKLGARAFDVLLVLVERRDRLVTKNELLELAWPSLVVEENNLQVQIWTLRKLLGPATISTIPGRGYRFTARLSTDAEPLPDSPPADFSATAQAAATALDALPRLFGREQELTDLRACVLAHRLVTVIGPGGIGKTSIAKAITAGLRQAFTDGAWVVDLAAVTAPAQLAVTVARALHITLGAGGAIEALANALQDRHVLILLDNCEHLLLPVAEMVNTLTNAAARLHCIATSQEPLRLPLEQVFRMGSLALPTLDALGYARRAAAVRLFEARAQQADFRFALTDDNIAAVVAICAQLDGIALAIELAAARVALLGVQGVLDRLGERLNVLGSSSLALPPRQRTLRAALGWSHALLSHDQQAVFRRLGVMLGRFSLDAAQQVAADRNMDEWAALDHLGALVEKSLVVAELGDHGHVSYRLLETMRHFALEKIAESGEEAATRERHVSFYLALAEQAKGPLEGPQQAAWLVRLDIDRDNLLAALAWCDHAENGTERGLRMAIALMRFWLNRGMMTAGHAACVAAAARPESEKFGRLLSETLITAGRLAAYRGLDFEARELLQRSVDIASRGGFAALSIQALSHLGYAQMSLGERAQARSSFEHAQRVAVADHASADNVIRIAVALAELERLEGNIDEARRLYESVLVHDRAQGDQLATMITLNNLSMVAVVQAEPLRARDMLLESLSISDALGSRRGRLVVMEVCAGLAATLGQWPLAPRFEGAADVHTVQMGRRRDLPDAAFLAPLIEQSKHALGTPAFAVALAEGRALSYDRAVADMSDWLRGLAGSNAKTHESHPPFVQTEAAFR